MKIKNLAACIALLAIGLSACQTKELIDESPEVAEPSEISCTMSATMPEFKAGGDPETRSSLESVVRVKWKKNDELTVINLTTGKQLGGCIKADNDGANSTFSPSGLHGTITAGDKLVFLLDNDPGRRSANEKDFEPFTMDYSSQKGNANEVPIVVYANYTATENGTISAVNPEFNFLMGYVQLAVSALPASTSVTELGIENLNTRCHFSISNHAFVTTPQNGSITLSEAFTANSKGTNTRYFSCFTSPSQGVARNAHICANSINHFTAWLKAALSAGYYYQAVATGFTNENISFVDDTFKSYCVSHYDKNGDGEISFAEAAAVTSFETFTTAEKSSLKEVYELPYFFKGERIPDFEGCTALKHILLPGTLQAIRANAFKGCTALEEITIPSNVTLVGEGAFEGCTSLERFNGTLASSDHRYLVRDNQVLAFAPAGLTETTIPEGATTIKAGVFANNTTIKTIYLSAELTTVEARAFKGCTALPIIRFRTNIASIGEEAFKGCSALRSVYSDAVTPPTVGTDAFANCHSSLTAHVTSGNLVAYEESPAWRALNVTTGQPWNEIWYTTTDDSVCNVAFAFINVLSNTYVDGKGIISLDRDVNSIASRTFSNKTSLTSISLPRCVTSIESDAFSGCSSLASISLPDGITSIGDNAFSNCSLLASISLPEGLESIGDAVFSFCSSLASIALPKGITSIGNREFFQCSSLASISLPDNLQSIGESAFYGCSSLASIALPEGLESIGDNTFYYCSSLTSISLPEGIESIGDKAFYNCSLLASITLPEGLDSIGNSAFGRCSSLASIALPEGLESIGDNTFYYCSSLASISLPENLRSIGESAFYGCSSLASITLPEGLESIGNKAFTFCRLLTSFTLPSTIESIGSYPFPSNLLTLFIKAITPPSGNLYSAGNIIQNIYVPMASVDIYKEAWPDCAGIISGYSFD